MDFLNKYETHETKLLNNEQLQRFVLLKQLRVANLQLKEMKEIPETSCEEIQLDFVGWDAEMPVETFQV